MHSYDFRCKQCQHRFTLTYKTYKDYDHDATNRRCPQCGNTQLSRLIREVAIQKGEHNYTRMSAQEMLGVFESGDSRQVGTMFQQIGGSSPELGMQYHEATQKLLKGESMDKVENDLRAQQPPKSTAES